MREGGRGQVGSEGEKGADERGCLDARNEKGATKGGKDGRKEGKEKGVNE